MAAMSVEFDCPDCGWHVVSFDGSARTTFVNGRRCFTCRFIADIPDPETRSQMRNALLAHDEPPQQAPRHGLARGPPPLG